MKNILVKNIKGLVGVVIDPNGPKRGKSLNELSIIEDAFLAIEDGRISFLAP